MRDTNIAKGAMPLSEVRCHLGGLSQSLRRFREVKTRSRTFVLCLHCGEGLV
jgi:hypothetical protein